MYTLKSKINCQSGKVYFSTLSKKNITTKINDLVLKKNSNPVQLIEAKQGSLGFPDSVYKFKIIMVYAHDIGGLAGTRIDSIDLEVDES